LLLVPLSKLDQAVDEVIENSLRPVVGTIAIALHLGPLSLMPFCTRGKSRHVIGAPQIE